MDRVQQRAYGEHKSIKRVLNEILKAGLDAPRPFSSGRWICPEHDLGHARVDYRKAFAIVDDMEADAVAEKISLRK